MVQASHRCIGDALEESLVYRFMPILYFSESKKRPRIGAPRPMREKSRPGKLSWRFRFADGQSAARV
jgi:hypothetical protein